MKKFILLVILTTLTHITYAQRKSATKSLNSLISVVDRQSVASDSLIKLSLPDSISRVQDAQLQQAYVELQLFKYSHIERTYQWNYMSTLIIFWVVILLVISGLIFSAIQFYKSMITVRDGKPTDEPSTIEASLQGIKITSSVLGVIVLIISMLFFYLYLVHVYPIITTPK